jgi:hypothetical protein
MKIYTALQIGDYHLNHCEDYLFTGEINSTRIVCAVMDGCTMANDSYFVSTLVGKLLHKICLNKSYAEFRSQHSADFNAENEIRYILQQLFTELNFIKNQLLLGPKDLLTTLIILVADKTTGNGMVLAIGDGFVSINGNDTIFDHDNKPDYIGFHLHEDFETWYNEQQQKISFSGIKDISIATDGLLLFHSIREVQDSIPDPVSVLSRDISLIAKEEMLSMLLKKLEHESGLRPGDDLAMIRIINN